MPKLRRFGISMEDDLLRQFDAMIGLKGYSSRSEAIRDIVRNALVVENVASHSGPVFGALVFVYDHHRRELDKSLANLQHEYLGHIISTTHVHIDQSHCMEVILLKGRATDLKRFAEHLLSLKGVEHGKLSLTATLHNHPKDHHHVS